MKQSTLFAVTFIALAIALTGLFLKWKGYEYGGPIFFVGLVLYLINRIAFYRRFRK